MLLCVFVYAFRIFSTEKILRFEDVFSFLFLFFCFVLCVFLVLVLLLLLLGEPFWPSARALGW